MGGRRPSKQQAETCSVFLFPPTDGIHSVTAQCVLRVIIITEDMLANSITVRLENMWQERFLSPLLSTFLEGVATVLATPKEDIFIFNIQNDTDVGGTVLNVSFSALAPRGGRYFSSEELQEQLYMKRMVLTGASMLEVLPFDDNVCLREPCQNYMKCISVLKFDSSAPFIASHSTLFRPIHPIAGLRCRCPQGFTGDYCETEINLCYSNPCLNGGICTRKEGGYTCVCRQHFSGECWAGALGDGWVGPLALLSPWQVLFPAGQWVSEPLCVRRGPALLAALRVSMVLHVQSWGCHRNLSCRELAWRTLGDSGHHFPPLFTEQEDYGCARLGYRRFLSCAPCWEGDGLWDHWSPSAGFSLCQSSAGLAEVWSHTGRMCSG